MASIKKYSKVKFTLRKELIFILAAIVVLVVATILLNLPTKEEKFIEEWQEAGVSITKDNNIFEKVTFEELEKELNKKEANEISFVFFGTSTDEESVTYFNTLLSLAELYNVEKIYFVDSAFMVDKDRETDAEFNQELTAIESKFVGDADSKMDLDLISDFWVFQGKVLVEGADDYVLSGSINWSLALIQMFSYAKAQ